MDYASVRSIIGAIRQDNTLSIVDSASNLFDKFNVESYLDTYESVLTSTENNSDEENVAKLVQTIYKMLLELIRGFGVHLNEGLLISDLIYIVEGFSLFPDYEDTVLLQRIIDEDASDEEKIAELLALVTPLTVEHILTHIDYVNSSIFVSLTDYIKTDAISDNQTDITYKNKLIQRYVAYKTFANRDIYADSYYSNIDSVGELFHIYLHLYLQQCNLLTEVTDDKLTQLAYDLYGIAILSSDGFNNPYQVIKVNSHKLFNDLIAINKFEILTANLMQGFKV